MKQVTIPVISVFSMFFVGCTDPIQPTATTKIVDVPGQLSVRFSRRVEINHAYNLMDKLSLQVINFSNLENYTVPNWGTTGVPEGKEIYWMKKLSHYPMVMSANPKTRRVPI